MSSDARILAVDDDPLELVLIAHALSVAGFSGAKLARGAGEAIAWLDALDAKAPALVLLDMRLRAEAGLEVLRHLRGAAAFRDVPVVMFTSSAAACDIAESYAERANAYVVKPVDALEFRRAIAETAAFWIERNMTPPRLARPTAAVDPEQSAP